MLLIVLVLAARGADAQPPDPPSADSSGERLEVVDFDIESVRALRETALRPLFETRESPRAPWRDRVYFDPAVLEADLRSLEAFYTERGYPHTRVESVVDRRGAGEAAVRIVVHEGEPVRATDVVFSGFSVLPVDRLTTLRESAPLQPGEAVALADVQETARLALNVLRNAGYAYARLEALETMVAPDRVRIEFRAEPGLQTVFGSIRGGTQHSDRHLHSRVRARPTPGRGRRRTPVAAATEPARFRPER